MRKLFLPNIVTFKPVVKVVGDNLQTLNQRKALINIHPGPDPLSRNCKRFVHIILDRKGNLRQLRDIRVHQLYKLNGRLEAHALLPSLVRIFQQVAVGGKVNPLLQLNQRQVLQAGVKDGLLTQLRQNV